MLDPEVVVRADGEATRMGAAAETRGAAAVAEGFKSRARGARLALIDGEVGAAWMTSRGPKVAFHFIVEGGKIVEIELLAEPAVLGELTVEVLEGK